MGTILSESVKTFENPLVARFEEGNPPESLCAAVYDLNPIYILPTAIGIAWLLRIPCPGPCCEMLLSEH